MWSMPVVLTEMENENDSANQSYIAKMTLQKWRCKKERALATLLADGITSTNNPLFFMFGSYYNKYSVTSHVIGENHCHL